MGEEYAREVLRRSVATACEAFNFTQSQTNSVDTLADVVRVYIEKLGELSRNSAECGNRARPGVQDVARALGQLSSEATTWEELRDFAFETVKDGDGKVTRIPRWVQPFALSVPKFPVKERSTSMVPQYSGKRVRGANVPSHLPLFPPEHSYRSTKQDKKRRTLASKEAQHVRRIADNRSLQEAIARIENEKSITCAETASNSSSSSSSSSRGGDGDRDDRGAGDGSKQLSNVLLQHETLGVNGIKSRDVRAMTRVEKMSLGIGR